MSFVQNNHNGVIYYTAETLTEPGGVTHGFSTRVGGVSRGHLESLNLGRSRDDVPAYVQENHQRFSAALGTDLDHIVICQQVHSNTVRVVTEEDALTELFEPARFEADGLVTNCPGLTLTIFYADCIPVLLYDPVLRVVGAVHSGWRGTAGKIVAEAVTLMQRHFGSHLETIQAAIGPGICPRCFETHDDVPTAMEKEMGRRVNSFITPIEGEKYQVDLKGIIANTLIDCGLLPGHIETSDLCTCCNPDLFWSHRKLGEARGNQAAMIALKERGIPDEPDQTLVHERRRRSSRGHQQPKYTG